MTSLYLIRHAHTAWNGAGRMQGWEDVPLDERGQQQAEALARRLRAEPIQAVYASPLSRSLATAEALAQALGLPLRCDDRLRERHLGEWSGLTFAEARLRNPDRFEGDWRVAGPPGGESQAQLVARAAAVMNAVVQAHPEQTVAVVSHGGVLSAYLAHLLGIRPEEPVSFSFPNTGIAHVVVRPWPNQDGADTAGADGEQPWPPRLDVRVLRVGDDRHLDGLRPA